jgi:hypothetical protein
VPKGVKLYADRNKLYAEVDKPYFEARNMNMYAKADKLYAGAKNLLLKNGEAILAYIKVHIPDCAWNGSELVF